MDLVLSWDVFLGPTWILLAMLNGKLVFFCASFGCEREWEAVGAGWQHLSPLRCCGHLLQSNHMWGVDGMEGNTGVVSVLGLNFLTLVPVLLLGL